MKTEQKFPWMIIVLAGILAAAATVVVLLQAEEPAPVVPKPAKAAAASALDHQGDPRAAERALELERAGRTPPPPLGGERERITAPGKTVDLASLDADPALYATPQTTEKIRAELAGEVEPERRKELINMHMHIAPLLADPGEALEADTALTKLIGR